MSKIVIDARESGTSTGRYIDKLIEYLHKVKPKHEIVVLAHKHRLEFLSKIAPKFEIVETRYKEFTFSEQIGLLRQIKKLGADLVHFGMIQQPVLYRGRVVTTMHDLTTARFRNPDKNWLIFMIKQSVYKWVNRIAAKKSKAIITASEYVKEDVARFARINSRKITVTYEAADEISEPSKPVNELIDQKFIMYVGRPQPHKNLERLIEAFSAIKQSRPDMKLALVGKKDNLYKRLEKKVSGLGIEDVVFTDFVGEGQLKWLYENTSTYVFPSLSEGFGLPGLEAMVHGAPVVSSNATCLPEIYGEAAEYFDPLDTELMVKAINRVLKDKERARSMIRLGKRQANKYSWQKTAEQTLEVYNQILEPPTPTT